MIAGLIHGFMQKNLNHDPDRVEKFVHDLLHDARNIFVISVGRFTCLEKDIRVLSGTA